MRMNIIRSTVAGRFGEITRQKLSEKSMLSVMEIMNLI